MISGLKIGNFKAFGKEQEIPLRPITLIFGPNSAGKSSIIQSLLLARHIQDTGNVDAHQTTLGGAAVDLGGFAKYVHQRQGTRNTTIHFTFKRSVSAGKGRYLGGFEKLTIGYSIGMSPAGRSHSQPVIQSATLWLDECELLHLVRTENGELQMDKAALLDRSFLGLADIWTADDLERWETLRGVLAKMPERRQKILNEAAEYGLTSGDIFDPKSGKPSVKGACHIVTTRLHISAFCDGNDPSERQAAIASAALERERPLVLGEAEQLHKDAIIRELSEMRFQADRPIHKCRNPLPRENYHYEESPAQGGLDSPGCNPFAFYKRYLEQNDPKLEDTDLEAMAWAMTLRYDLENLIEAAGNAVQRGLESATYLGPLRWIPPRFIPEGEQYDASWKAGGGNAWQRLRHEPELLERVNRFLRDELKTSYQLKIEAFGPVTSASVPAETSYSDPQSMRFAEDPPPTAERRVPSAEGTITVLSIVDATANPPIKVSHRDVGTGISQLLPVLVNAAGSEECLIMIEQPELHLHPALQAELGDVFIESALGESKNTFLIETHSEHLILRLLRRIRETATGALREGMTPVRPEDVCVLYIEPGKDGSKVVHLPVNAEGDFDKPWPEGFFAERARELFSLEDNE